MDLRILFLLLIGVFVLSECYPVQDWKEDPCSRRNVIEMSTLQGHINSKDVHLKPEDNCQMWKIQAAVNQSITIRFTDFMSGAFACNLGAYVQLGPAPKSTLCGVPKLPFTYHSKRDHVWIKLVISNGESKIPAFFKLDYISEMGDRCPDRCTNGMCIYSQWRCNGYAECLDSSDEMSCNSTANEPRDDEIIPSLPVIDTKLTTSTVPSLPQFGCTDTGLYCLNAYLSYTCIPPQRHCDGKHDCLRGEDEANCKAITMTTSPPEPANPCDYGEIYCMVRGQGSIYRCLHNIHKCDGIYDCVNDQDENPAICRKEVCSRRLEDPSGWFAPPFWGNHCSWVFHQLESLPKSKIQLRKVFFHLEPTLSELEMLRVYDGPDATYPLIGQYDGLNQPPPLIESSSNWLYAFYQSVEEKKMAFNFTYQTKGTCLSGQMKCDRENDCFEMSQLCNGVWDCPTFGSDEMGCGRCLSSDYNCGVQTGQCYHKEERCNGITRCSSKVDEINCTSTQCGSHNGTFLCDNRNCIYESWVCDQRDDCGDNSDEQICGGSTKRVIIAAISGSMVCALLLVILMGCSCKLYSLRVVDHRRIPRHETPMSRLYAEFLRRRAPPPYHEAMLTSRNFDEVQQEFLERSRHASNRTRRGRRSRSRNSQQNQDGDTNNNREQGMDGQETGDVLGHDGEDGVDLRNSTNQPGVSESVNSNNDNIERHSSTGELIPSDSQTGSSESEDSDISDDAGDTQDRDTNHNGPTEAQSDEENILMSESLSNRWARAAETESLSDEECILDDNASESPSNDNVSESQSIDNVSESASIDNNTETVRFSTSFRDYHCDSASVDTGSMSVNSIELPEITSTAPEQNDPDNGNDSDCDKLDDDLSGEYLPKPDNCRERSLISGPRRLSQGSLDSEGSELLSDNDVPLLPLHKTCR